MTRIYYGLRQEHEAKVTVAEFKDGKEHTRPLDPKPSLKLRNHSPTGFEWGYRGSGPAQLALAVLLDHFDGDPTVPLAWYQDFKEEVIAHFDKGVWALNDGDITEWLKTKIATTAR